MADAPVQGPDWPEVRVAAEPATVELLEAWLFEAGALSVTYRDREGGSLDTAILEPEPGSMPLWREIMLVGLFAQGADVSALHTALADAAGSLGLALPRYRLAALADEPWERAWMAHFEPMPFGQWLWICPSHHEPVPAPAVNLLLDPGLAFGTGTHPTTAQVLSWLGQRMRAAEDRPLQGIDVIDYGCGSGVLAIAAALLGARSVLAIDIDPQALEATRRNADANGVADRIEARLPDSAPPPPAALVLANILYTPLLALHDTFAACTHGAGELLMTGILTEQIAPLTMRYNSCFDIRVESEQEGWALLHATRLADE